ncbi:TPA: hypothetical protein QB352_000775 [Pasteurella multocida]|nr:hypothetical protein [Pasteurella multocida]
MGAVTHNIALGASAGMGVKGNTNIAIGVHANSFGKDAFLTEAVSTDNNIAIGERAEADGKISQSPGDKAAGQALALGNRAKAIGGHSIAVGAGAKALNQRSLAIGTEANATSFNSTALGYRANAIGDGSMAFGYYSISKGNYSLAGGVGSKSDGTDSLALGRGNIAGGGKSVSLGANNNAEGLLSVVLGAHSKAIGREANAFGYLAEATSDRSMALGSNTKTTQIDSVALGSFSLANTQAGKLGYYIFDDKSFANETAVVNFVEKSEEKVEADSDVKEKLQKFEEANKLPATDKDRAQKIEEAKKAYDLALAKQKKITSTWKSTKAAISVGSAESGDTRQITNVAAGTEDTDAVNVAQLKTVRLLGIDFIGNNSANTKLVKRKLTEKLTIKGEGTFADVTQDKPFESAAENIYVDTNSKDTLEIKLAKKVKNLTSVETEDIKDGITTKTTLNKDGIKVENKDAVKSAEYGLDGLTVKDTASKTEVSLAPNSLTFKNDNKDAVKIDADTRAITLTI